MALTVPSRAVGTDQDRKFLYVVSPENKVRYREITLGESVNGSRIVVSGLAPGDVVITDGIMKVQPEMAVVPQFGEEKQGAPMQPEAQPLVPAEEMPEEKIAP